MQPRPIEYFLYVAKEDETTASIYSQLTPEARKHGVILYPDPNSRTGSSSSGACEYKAHIIINNQELKDSVSMGNQLLPKGLLTSENENYAELIKMALTRADREKDVPTYIKTKLALQEISLELRERELDRLRRAYKLEQKEAEEQRKQKENMANDAAIFHLIASDPEPAQEETKSPTLEQEHKNPRSRNQPTVKPNSTDLTDGPLVPGDLIDEMLVFSGWNPNIGHAAAPLVSTLFNSIKPQKMARLKELLTAIVNGDLDSVEKLLEKDPSLLLEKLDEDDYVTALSGQKSNNATAYRTALAVEDSQMATLIRNKLFELTGNNDEANAQYREQRPDGWEADEAKRWAPLFTTLDTLTTVIRDVKPGVITSSGDPEYKLTVKEGSDVAVVLAQFRSQLDALLNEVVTTGRHFNPNLLLKAFQIYDDHFRDYFGNDWNDPRAMLFWQQVIGTIQRRLPVNYVQAFCDGLYTTEEKLRNNQPQGRSLKIDLFNSQQQSWVPRDFYPLAGSRLGFDYAVYGAAGMRRAGHAGVGRGWVFFEAYVNQKQCACRHLYPTSPKTLEDAQRFAR